ncbi:MAG: hypothetical protein ABSG36_17780 [Acidimicrobiales bacterium]|jgi:hypothetical protein
MWPSQTVRLRPLGVGERIDAAIKIVRANFLTLVKAAAIVAIPAGVLTAIISVSVVSSGEGLLSSGTTNSNLGAGTRNTLVGGELLTVAIAFVVGAFVTAVCFRIIANSYLGQRANWREALRFGWSKVHSVLWIDCLIALALTVGSLAIGVLIAIAVAIHLAVLSVLFAVMLGIGGFVAAVWFLVAVNLAVPILMIENIRGAKAIRRALNLCRGYWWSVFGTQLLAGLLAAVASFAINLILDLILGLFHGGTVASFIDVFVVQSIYYVVLAPFYAAILVVLTIDLRVRKEGFDIQLLSTQMGVAPSASALFLTEPAPGWGYGRPGSPPPGDPQQPGPWYRSGPTGYPPVPPGYPPPPAPPYPAGYMPPTPQTGYSPPNPGWPRPSDSPSGSPNASPTQPPPGWPRPSDSPPGSPPGYVPLTQPPEGPQPAESPTVPPSYSPPPPPPSVTPPVIPPPPVKPPGWPRPSDPPPMPSGTPPPANDEPDDPTPGGQESE